MRVYMTGRDYEQDIRPLIKAFFPEEALTVIYGEEAETAAKSEAAGKGVCFAAEDTRFALLFLVGGKETDREEQEVLEPPQDAWGASRAENEKRFRKWYRDEVKRALYRLLARVTGRTLPWGTLTGIRPTKPVLALLEQGRTEEEVRAHYTEQYYCSAGKQALSLRVAKKELALLKEADYKESYSLYIGIPFCPTTCLYCSFTSYPLEKFRAYTEPYLAALKKEIAYAAGCFPDKKPATVYFGGGTPTSLEAGQLRDLIRTVKRYFPTEAVKEWTVEAGRPDSITREKLAVLREEGVTRISINPQTMQQRTLDLIGRRHTAEQIKEAYALARELGFDNINMDLILGLTGEGKDDVIDTLGQVGALSPDSVTVHTLALKRAARLNAEKEQYRDKKATDVKGMIAEAERFAAEHGYEPYYLYRQKNMEENLENVGYAKPGKEGLYNVLIMEEKHTILALGAGAATKFVFPDGRRIERVENVKSLTDYIGRIEEMIKRKQEFLKTYPK